MQPYSHQHHCSTFQLIGSGCVIFKNAYIANSRRCLQVRRLDPPCPNITTAAVMQPCFFLSTPLLLMQSCWRQSMLLLLLLCLITSCVFMCGGHCVHVRLCTCIVAHNRIVCARSEPAWHTLFILCVYMWLCWIFLCPRCPWRSILCISSLMKAPKREGERGGGGRREGGC